MQKVVIVEKPRAVLVEPEQDAVLILAPAQGPPGAGGDPGDPGPPGVGLQEVFINALPVIAYPAISFKSGEFVGLPNVYRFRVNA